jgi:hypothetical protein
VPGLPSGPNPGRRGDTDGLPVSPGRRLGFGCVGGRLSVPGRGRGPIAGPFFVSSGLMSGFGRVPERLPKRLSITRRRGLACLSLPPVLGGGFVAVGRCGRSAAGFLSGLLRGRALGERAPVGLSLPGRAPTGRRGLLGGGASRRGPGVLALRRPPDRGTVLGRVPRVAVGRFGCRCFGGGAALRPGLRLPALRPAGFLVGAWRCFGGGAALRPGLRLPALRLAGFFGGAWRCLPRPAALPPRADTTGPRSGPSAAVPWTGVPAAASSSAARITPQRRMHRPWI